MQFLVDYINDHRIAAELLLHFARFPKTNKIFHNISMFILTVFLLKLILVSTITFGIYKGIVHCLLRLWKGRNFLGILRGNDVIVTGNREVSNALVDVYIVESEKIGEDFFKEVGEHLSGNLRDGFYERLVSMKKEFMGYLYYEAVGVEDFGGGDRKEKIRFKDFFKEVKVDKSVMDEEDFVKVLDACYNSLLPLNNKFNFDVTVCTTPYKDRTKILSPESKHCFVIIFRISHTLVDGSTMYNLLTNLLCKPEITKNSYSKNLLHLASKSKYTLIPTTNLFKHKNPLDTNFSSKTEQASIACYLEKTEGYLQKIKLISKTQENLSFSSVLLTAFSISLSKSLEETINKEEIKLPEYITLVVPRQMDFERFTKMYSNRRHWAYGNDFSGFAIQLPLITKTNLINDLQSIAKIWNDALKFYEIKLNYSINLQLFDILPHLLTRKYILNRLKMSAALSNFPGGPKLKLFNGDEVKEKFILVNLADQSFGLSVYTYDERLQLGLVGKRDRWNNKILNKILLGMFQEIDDFERDVLNVKMLKPTCQVNMET